MNNKINDLTREEQEFVADLIIKEVFFAIASGQATDLTESLVGYTEWEKQKLEEEGIGSDDYPRDIALATSIIEKLSSLEDHWAGVREGGNK